MAKLSIEYYFNPISVKSIRDGYSFNFSGSIIKFTREKPNPNDSRIIPISIKIKRIISPN